MAIDLPIATAAPVAAASEAEMAAWSASQHRERWRWSGGRW
jgi:hypothetical protein